MCLRFLFLVNIVLGSVMPLSVAKAADSIPGTGDGIEILQAMAEAFGRIDGARAVEIPASIGSGGGIAAVSDGRAKAARIARPLTPSELAAGLVAMPIMKIPSTFFAHASAGVTGLTYAQVADIFAGNITNWSEVGGANLKIRVVRRENEDSTLKILRATLPGWKDLAITQKSKTAVTTQDCVQTVMDIQGAIGFGPRSSAVGKGITILSLDGVESTSPDYPSAVTVSFVKKTGPVSDAIQGFVAFSGSQEAQALIRIMGGIPGSS